MVSNAYCVVFLFYFSSSCVPYVVSFSGLFMFGCPFGIRVCLRLVYPMFSVSLDVSYLIAPSVFSNVYSQRITNVVVLNWAFFDHKIV